MPPCGPAPRSTETNWSSAVTAPVPLWPVVAGAALPLAEFGSPEQRVCWLPAILDGSAIITAAPDAAIRSTAAATAAGASTAGCRACPGLAADGIVLPVRLDRGCTAVALVLTDRAGVDVAVAATDRQSAAAVCLSAVPLHAGDLLRADGTDVAGWTLRRCRVALAGLQGESLCRSVAQDRRLCFPTRAVRSPAVHEPSRGDPCGRMSTSTRGHPAHRAARSVGDRHRSGGCRENRCAGC